MYIRVDSNAVKVLALKFIAMKHKALMGSISGLPCTDGSVVVLFILIQEQDAVNIFYYYHTLIICHVI